jgi:hypothetical protein
MTVAKGISVTVLAVSLATGKPVKQSYPTTPKSITAGKSSPFGPVQPYTYVRGVMTPQAAALEAEKLYNQIVSHAMKISAHLVGDNVLAVSTPITVQGTGTAADQTYFPMSIKREMSVHEGYSMSVDAQNLSPNLDLDASAEM